MYIHICYICHIVFMIPCHGYNSKIQWDRAPELCGRPEDQSPRPRCESWDTMVDVADYPLVMTNSLPLKMAHL